jgi:hypothetical protein
MKAYAYEMQIGDFVKLNDESYGEIIDLQPADLGKSVWITIEGEGNIKCKMETVVTLKERS